MTMQPDTVEPEVPPRKPRIALMGEFSAGKSTLMNLLLGCDPMPVRITATRVPPVWVSYGARATTLVHADGSETPYEGADFSQAPMQDTALIRFSMDSDILNLCDLIDIPGISDPNLKHETWTALLEEVDCVIWCTHATQAWRQSEAALWEEVCTKVAGPNHLVVTQFDKLRSERDQGRVMARLQAEAGDAFDVIIPVATLNAIQAGQDEAAWRASGGAALIECMVAMLVRDAQAPKPQGNLNGASIEVCHSDVPKTVIEAKVSHGAAFGGPQQAPLDCAVSGIEGKNTEDEKKVVPRRVRPKSPNPDRPSSEDLQVTPIQALERHGDP